MGLLGFYSRAALRKMKIKHFAVTEEISSNARVDLWGATSSLYHIVGVLGTFVQLPFRVDSSRVRYWLFHVPKAAF